MIKGVLLGVGLLGLLVLAVLFSVRQAAGVDIVIKNSGPETMRDVVVVTSGGSFPVGNIEVETSRSVRVSAQGESRADLRYTDESGDQKQLMIDCYFENGYRGTIEAEVKAGKVVRVKSNVRMF